MWFYSCSLSPQLFIRLGTKQRQKETHKTLTTSYILTQREVQWEWEWSGLCLPLVITTGAKARWNEEAVYTLGESRQGRDGVMLSHSYAMLPALWHPYCMPTVEPASSPLWRVMALTLLVLCVGMVVGLVALGLMCKYWLFPNDVT